jgi:hypothetical protein
MVRFRSVVQQALAGILILPGVAALPAMGQRFLPDDPLMTVPEAAPVTGKVKVQSINELYDFAVNSAESKPPARTDSLAINTLGEVPDSSWFTNRDIAAMSVEELRKGARSHGAPQPPFAIVAAKTEGVTPGFRMTDARGLLYFVKVDPRTNPEMASAADVVASLFLYAAGYNVPENYILVARREDFQLAKKATVTGLSGRQHPMTKQQLEEILDEVPKQPDGHLRVMASLALPGQIAGPFRYVGMRSDDPNDIVPHQRRRDLRGLEVLFAWLNHTDAKGGNSMDTVNGEGEQARFRHNLIDFGDSFGSDSDIAKDPRHGAEYFLPATHEQWQRAYTLGLKPAAWETVHYPHKLKSIGNFTSEAFNPLLWKPNYPNQAFLAITPEDGYWGAKRVMAFTSENIRSLVEEAQFTNPAATDYMAKVLEARREAIGRAWFARVLPLEQFAIADGRIGYKDLNVVYGLGSAQTYTHEWFNWDNERQQEQVVTTTTGDSLPDGLKGPYIGCRLSYAAKDERSTTAYFHREGESWKLVGIKRTARN